MNRQPHTIEIEDVVFADQWHIFASSAGYINKKFQIKIGDNLYRVLHKQEVVYEGRMISNAVEAYNNIVTSEPIDQSKL